MMLKIVIALVGAIAVAILAVIFPFLGVLVLNLLTFGRPQDGRPNVAELHVPLMMMIAVFVGTLLRFGEMGPRMVAAVKRMWLMLLIYGLMVISALANGMTRFSTVRIDQFLTIIVFVVFTLTWLTDVERFRKYVAMIVVSGTYVIGICLKNPAQMREEISGQKFERLMLRGDTAFGGSNYLALLMVMIMFLCLALLSYYRKTWQRGILVGVLCGAGYVFFMANSRGASIAFGMGLFTLWLFQKRKAASLAIGVVLLGAAAAFAPASYWDRLSTVATYEEDRSATDRIVFWGIALNLIKEHPLLGVGPDNFELYAPNTPHNAYLQIGSEVGIPALLLYVLWLSIGLFTAMRVRRATHNRTDDDSRFLYAVSLGFFCCILAVCIQGFTTGLAHRELAYAFVILSFKAQDLAKELLAVNPATEENEVKSVDLEPSGENELATT